MKKLLLLFTLFWVSQMTITAQTVTWIGGGGDTNWSTLANWSTGMLPIDSNDVIIPNGSIVTLNVTAAIKSIDLQGTSVFTISAVLNFTEPSTFGPNTTVQWTSGTLNGTTTLDNLGTINLTTTANHVISGDMTFTNSGSININSSGDLMIIGNGTVLNNPVGGTIDMRADFGDITYSGSPGVINNTGLIKKTTTSGIAQLIAPINNNGTIQIEAGTLNIENIGKNFNGGVYNVFTDALMNWNTTINPTGILTGTIDGNLNWNANVNIPVGQEATFDFDLNQNFNWTSGTLSGGGTLNNTNVIKLTTTSNHMISGDTTLNNLGSLNITSSGDLFLNGAGTILNNPIGGIIDMQADAGDITYSGAPGVINNAGIIKKTTSTGTAAILTPLNNNDGTLQVEMGTLSLQNTPKNLNDGNYNVYSGAVLAWDITINPTGTLEGIIDGDLNWNTVVNVPVGQEATFDFELNQNFYWTSGTLSGGGTLNNTNVIKLTTTAIHIISGDTTLNNLGSLNLTSSGDLLLIGAGTILNNPVGGIIDMQADFGDITWSSASGVINNAGTIKKTTSTGTAAIISRLNNNNGSIQVEAGTLSLQNVAKNLTDGNYNVAAGAIMNWDTTINPAGNLTGTIAGALNWNNVVNVVDGTFASFDFDASDNFNWTSGTLSGGGTLTNTNVLKLTTTSNHIITGDTTLNNLGSLNLTSSGDLFLIGAGTILNNQIGGIIDFQADFGDITYSGTPGVINNAGLIRKTTSSGAASLIAPINNNDGTIQVEVGTLNIQNISKNFNDGTYNVFTDAVMNWDTPINILGDLTGTIAGALNWNSTVTVADGTFATFDFGATDNFFWRSGTLTGGGTLTNNNVLKLTTTANHTISGINTTLNNLGSLNITSSGDLLLLSGTIINNTPAGVIDMQADFGNITYSGTSGILNNAGLLKRTTTNNIAQIFVPLNNSGTIDVQSGELEIVDPLAFVNETTGNIKGTGIFDLPTLANYTNNGTFAPGSSAGTLTVQGDFKSSTTSVLDLELNGLTAGTEYDVLAIEGTNNEFNGTVNVTLGFEPLIGDVFTVVTTTGTITTKNLTTPFTSDYLGFRYTFEVTYPGDNSVQLEVTNKVDIEAPTVVTQNVTVQLDASGNATVAAAQVNDGSTDNFSLPGNLTYSLDITSFTCADIGPNTVTLTVTDEASNAATGTAVVTVVDLDAPSLICGANSTVTSETNYILPDYVINSVVSVSDNCGATIVQTPVPGSVLADGVYTITFVATDSSGNMDTCSFDLTVDVNSEVLMVSLSSDDDDDTFPYGTSVTFTATAMNTSGGTVNYDFLVDGTSVQNGASNTYTVATLTNGQQVSVIATSGSETATSNTISNTVSAPILVNFIYNCGGLSNIVNPTFYSSTPNVGASTLAYRFKITNTNTSTTMIVDRNVPNINLQQANMIAYSTLFTAQVAAVVNGLEQPYSAVCSVTTPGVITVSPPPNACGGTLAAINSRIYVNSVPNATQYTYRVAVASAPNVYYTYSTPFTNFRLTAVPGLPLTFETTYNVSVNAVVNGNPIGYGATLCQYTTPSFPTTQLQTAQCGGMSGYQVPSNTTLLFGDFVSGATYTFKIEPMGGGMAQTITRPVNYFSLNLFSGLMEGTDYKVSVALTYYGAGPFGAECIIRTPSMPIAVTRVIETPFSAIVYPNPFATSFTIDVTTKSTSLIGVKVYDMLGRLMEQSNVKATDLERMTIGNQYPSGIYNVIVTQDSDVSSVRMIKR